jgi:hypothetical protein
MAVIAEFAAEAAMFSQRFQVLTPYQSLPRRIGLPHDFTGMIVKPGKTPQAIPGDNMRK